MNAVTVSAIHVGDDTADGIPRLEAAVALVRRAAGGGSRLTVLPELAWSNLAALARDGMRADEASLYHHALDVLAGVAAETSCAIVAPLVLSDERGGWHNGAAVIDERGAVVGTATKHRLPPGPDLDESAVFRPGRGWCVADAGGLRVGVLICADRRDPVNWLALRDRGADVAAVLVAGSGADAPGMVLCELRTYARLACLGAVFACRAGVDRAGTQAVTHHAETCVVAADGSVAAGPFTGLHSEVASALLEPRRPAAQVPS